MRLEADDAVEDLHAGIFQSARPADVGGFVEAGLQLDHRRDFFAGGRIDESVDDAAIFRWCDRASA